MPTTLLGDTATGTSSLRRPVALGLTVCLGALTAAVAQGTWPVNVDREVAAALPASGAHGLTGFLLVVADAVTTLGTPAATVLMTLTLTVWMTWQERDRTALRAVAAPLLALVVSVLVGKVLLARPGPLEGHVHGLLGYYPSGHTATALVCGGILSRLISARYPKARRPLTAAAASWTLLIGSSLVYHRYHWLSDVLAGLLLGCLILILTESTARPRPAAKGEAERLG